MRIAIFTDSYYPYISGLVVSVDTLKKSLEKLGHDVYIVTVNYDNNKFILDKQNKIIRLPGIKTFVPGGKIVYPYSLQTINAIRKWKIDIIHSQTEFGIGTLARVIGKQLNIPIVHTYHTMYDDYIYYVTKGYFDYLSHKLLEEFTKFYCDKTISELIVPTEKVREKFLEKYDFDRDINIVPTGLELERFYEENINKKILNSYKEEFNIKENDFIISYLGRVAKEKNISFLINAMPKIIEHNKNIKLLICGSGNDLDNLKKLVDRKKINNNVIFTGLYPYELAPYYYHLCSTFVLASKTETQGVTVIEALASSKPVVCINDKSYEGTVYDNYNGLIFKNQKEYIEKIIYLYKNQNIIKEYSINARKSVEKYSMENFGKNVIKIYEKALEKKKKIPIEFPIVNEIKEMVKGLKDEKNDNSKS